MAQHGKHYSSSRSRRTARKVSDATIGTHVTRSGEGARGGTAPKQASYSNARIAARASESHIDTFMPQATSGEDAAAYRRRSQQLRYVESVQRRARIRRIATALVALVVVVGVALGAGWLALRGVLGSQMSLRGSNAAEALSAPKADEVIYTLVAAELGEVAEPLAQEGPDMLLLMADDRQSNKLSIISIPPSLKVTVDNDTKRLADMATEGDASLISSVESYTKLDIHHFVKIPEGGLASMVDKFGDIEVTFDQIIDDPSAGDVYFPQGTYEVNGSGAMTYLRATNVRMGKTDQAAHQATFVQTLLLRVVKSPLGLAAELDGIDDYFQTDLTLSQIEDFAKWVNQLDDSAIACYIIPGYFTTSSDIVGENDELFVSKSNEFAEFLEEIQSNPDDAQAVQGQVQTADPKTFTVEVWNGTDITGAGQTTAEALAEQGFRIANVGNAEQQVYDETLVVYRTANTPKPETAQALDEDGNPIGDEYAQDEGAYEGESVDDGGTDQGEASAQSKKTDDEKLLEEGPARANAVIQALGIGRAIEGDMYYAFDADVLVVIGYDYKPVA